MRQGLRKLIGRRRAELGWTQAELAMALGSSASRVNKLERGAGSVSLDLYARALEVMGLKLRLVADDAADPLADPAIPAHLKRDLARRMLRERIAATIAKRHAVDAGDVAHVLRNLTKTPEQRLAGAFDRAKLIRQATAK